MLRALVSFGRVFALVSTPLLLVGACSAVEPSGEPAEEVEEAASLVGSPLVGTFTSSSTAAGDFTQLVLKSDGSYRAAVLVHCVTAPCPPIEQTGRFRAFRRDSGTFITLLRGGRDPSLFRYKLRGDILLLQAMSPERPWQSLMRADDAWCGEPQDCGLQNLAHVPCSGHWSCEESACRFTCGRVQSD